MSIDIAEEGRASLVAALKDLGSRLGQADAVWLLGGSCSLWLQGVPLERPPRDIDVYYDKAEAKKLHDRLTGLALDEPVWDESGRYSSLLSHYRMGELTMELVGGFEIRNGRSMYRTEVSGVLAGYAEQIMLEDVPIRLMPLAHELLFNVLRERSDRYRAVAEAIRKSPERQMGLLKLLLARNEWEAETVMAVADLLEAPEVYEEWLLKARQEL
ncbi:hypothetical protein YSY43_24020 [Paenibacillus sp. YSY-4.3]